MSTRNLEFKVNEQVWLLDKPFRIARGTRTEARVIVVTVNDSQHIGRAEAVPSKRYAETVTSVVAQLEQILSNEQKIDRQRVQHLMPAGAARNALDCALWDLEAKSSGKRVWELANIQVADAVQTALTISLDPPEKMAAAVQGKAPILKLKLGGDDLDLPRVEAVRREAPAARLLVDANESWSPSHYRNIVPALHRLGIELIEQPFPADAAGVLATLDQ